MSYCRWSSDNWSCDVYCYEDAGGGWTTHVAARRHVGEVPQVPAFPDVTGLTVEEAEKKIAPWGDLHRAQLAWLGSAEYQDIGLPHDGETYNDATLEEFHHTLAHLRSVGYRVPDYVFDEINEEIVAAKSGQSVPIA